PRIERDHRYIAGCQRRHVDGLKEDRMANTQAPVIGFVGLGVMGGAMCRNIALKHDGEVIAYDAVPAAFAALDGTAATKASSVADVAGRADIVFLSLPCGPHVESVCLGENGLASGERRPALIVDLSITAVDLARSVAERLSLLDVGFIDAPVARTREAAQRGELSVMVGATPSLFARVEPLLHHIGTDVTHCE